MRVARLVDESDAALTSNWLSLMPAGDRVGGAQAPPNSILFDSRPKEHIGRASLGAIFCIFPALLKVDAGSSPSASPGGIRHQKCSFPVSHLMRKRRQR